MKNKIYEINTLNELINKKKIELNSIYGLSSLIGNTIIPSHSYKGLYNLYCIYI